MKRWQKKPYWLRDAGFIDLTAAARGVFVSVYELLVDQPVLRGNMGTYSRWTGIDRHTLMRAFQALADADLLSIKYDEKNIITITDPRAEENANALPTHSERNANASQPDADLTQASPTPDAGLTKTSYKPDADLMQASCKPGAKFSTQEYSNDAGLPSKKSPLEENRIDKKRREEKRKEEKSAPVGATSAEPPPIVRAYSLEEAQEIIEAYKVKHPNRRLANRPVDGDSQPVDDITWASWITGVPDPVPQEAPKVTIMATRGSGKVKVERPEDCDEQSWKDWMKVRGRNALTETAWGAFLNEASKANISPAEAVRICAERSWRGFRAEWLDRDKVGRIGGRYQEEDLTNQDYRSHDGQSGFAGSAAEYFFGRKKEA